MSVSYLNSLVQQDVVNGFIFTGVYDSCLQYAQIQVIINTTTINNDYNIIIEYSNDQTVILYTENVNYCDIINNILYFTPKAKFIKVSLTANSNIDELSINTMFKVSNVFIPTVVSSISNDVLVHGDVKISATNGDAITVTENGLNVNVISTVQVIGLEPQFRFYATPATNTAAVYADGALPVNVNGGWLYVNNGAPAGLNKINWYVYSNTADQASTAKKISSINNMYAVIFQKPFAPVAPLDVKNPYIAFYTLPDAGTNTSWYKNRYCFSNYAEQSSVLGLKLLYTGTDDPLIHPEITTRIQLIIDPVTSTNTLAGGANEDLWLSTLQSSASVGGSTPGPTPAGEYNFVFSEYGINFTEAALQPIVLPIIADKVQISGAITSSVLPTGASTETTLSAINTKTPALGQQLEAVSQPVVLTSLQYTGLTSGLTNTQLRAAPLNVFLTNPVPSASVNSIGVSYVEVGQWYKVEIVGSTTLAIWVAMGATQTILGPPLPGKVFRCLAVGAGTGVVSVLLYNENVKVSNFPATQPVSGPLTDAQLRATDVNTFVSGGYINIGRITNYPFTSHTVGDTGIVAETTLKVIQNLMIQTIHSNSIYVYLYSQPTAPTSATTPMMTFLVKDTAPLSVFLNQEMPYGIAIRATTDLNGTTSPDANSLFVNISFM